MTLDERRLAATVVADDNKDLALVQLRVDAVQADDPPKGLDQTAMGSTFVLDHPTLERLGLRKTSADFMSSYCQRGCALRRLTPLTPDRVSRPRSIPHCRNSRSL